MREVKGYTQGEARIYVPKAYGNRSDPNPIRVHITTPTEGETRRIFSASNGSMRVRMSATGAPEIDLTGDGVCSWEELICRRHVTLIDGGPYTVRGKKITNGDELARFGEPEIVTEVANEIAVEASLSEEEKKTSNEPSDSSPPEIQASNGTAATAESAVSA